MITDERSAAYANALTGRPYDRDAFNCWHMVELVQRELFSREVNVGLRPGMSVREQLEMIEAHPERERWVLVGRWTQTQVQGLPTAGAIALMVKSTAERHAGVWLPHDRGGILHCDDPGVMFEPAINLRSSCWRKIHFYEPRLAVSRAAEPA